MAMKISFTFIDVFADVSINSKLLSSAYDWASCGCKVRTIRHVFTHLGGGVGCLGYSCQRQRAAPLTHLEVDGSLVGQVGLVARQGDDYIGTGLSL